MKEIKFICLKQKVFTENNRGYKVKAGKYTVFSFLYNKKIGPVNTGLFKIGCDRGTPFCQENMAMADAQSTLKISAHEWVLSSLSFAIK